VFQISVETFKGTVQLSGFMNSAEMRSRAGVVAGRVSGVKSVKNDLIVKQRAAPPRVPGGGSAPGC
jgi:osmotically-inducible protein OsmY